MKLPVLASPGVGYLALCTAVTNASLQAREAMDVCRHIPLPHVPVSDANRTVPWGKPTIQFANGTTCCSSLDQVLSTGDFGSGVHDAMLTWPEVRTAYVKEAVRFKSTIAAVDNTSRDKQIILEAIEGAPAHHLPQIVAQVVFQGIIDASVQFENCIFNTYENMC